jgi:hypothetical protein
MTRDDPDFGGGAYVQDERATYRHFALAAFAVAMLAAVAGCVTPTKPADLLVLAPSADAERELQTRRFDDVTETQLLAAVVGVFQDLGFQLRMSEARLGLVIGIKPRTLDDMLREAFTYPVPQPVPRPDKIEVVVTTRLAAATNARSYYVRVIFLRVRRDYAHANLTWAEELRQPALYQKFFALLSKALAREAHGLARASRPEPGSPKTPTPAGTPGLSSAPPFTLRPSIQERDT